MSPKDPAARLDALEETAGFAEHKAEQLEALVNDLSTQVYELSARLERLEKRLGDLESDAGDGQEVPNEPPPHSHRPL
jgi:uncharacterized coiled-coil protein SlyX